MIRFPLQAAVQRALRELRAPARGETLVVGLSGGADSVSLLDALAALGSPLGFRVVAAHLDHGLRPGSAEDARFCGELCRTLGVELRVGHADVQGRARREHGGIEEAARVERYAFLRRVKDETGAACVAVAHTRDDQAETLLLRLLRGAGSAGLGAMRRRSGDVLRPLLSVSRAEVLAHLAARGLSWREDPTNADLGMLRNRVRLELVPYLEERFNPRLGETLARTAELLAEDAELIAGLGSEIAARAERLDGGLLLPLEAIRHAAPAVARAALRGMLAAAGGLRGVAAIHVGRLLKLASSSAPSGRKLALPGGREAQFRFDALWVGPRPEPIPDYALELTVPGQVRLPDGGALVAESDPDARGEEVGAPGPLVVRTRRPGDRIRAHGRSMSLKRYLMDRRVPAAFRDRLPVVACGNRVLWFSGQAAEGPAPGEPTVRIELRPAGTATTGTGTGTALTGLTTATARREQGFISTEGEHGAGAGQTTATDTRKQGSIGRGGPRRASRRAT